ncbi:uncharacterized protein LOC113874340 [Abrus precatorius]|uniref:Uncharacterized protein LOC113874340 n=1 Tax=Abrus precatorius TaxID=3816 RepID=A0A8B8ML87_ABRPR|nr:uncharacterized protein LOC113874340 [Abrus precatorius]
MGSPFGWYGPLIDLSTASSHIGDFVQLLVFVHRSFSVQVSHSSKRARDLTRTHIQVGDDTMPYFVVSLWQKHMGSMVAAGDVVLLQNFKIAKYGDVVEARTLQWSSLLCLVHPYESLVSKAVEELIIGCRIGTITKDKLRRVIKWVQQSRSTICNIKLQSNQQIEHLPRNWTLHEETKPMDCFSLMEVSQLTTSCKAIVCASIGEIVPLLTTWTSVDAMKEIFLSKRFHGTEDKKLVDDFLCTGCQLCGSPLDSKHEKSAIPLICSKSSSRLHSVCLIYRPFMLYEWDESDYLPVLVRNRAAEILFGNIKAGKVYSSYKEQMPNQNCGPRNKYKDEDAEERLANNLRLSGEEFPSANTLEVGKSLQLEEKHFPVKKFDFYRVWLIFLKMLLKQGKNSPLKFEIIVDPSLDIENGKFEMISTTMPCFGTN